MKMNFISKIMLGILFSFTIMAETLVLNLKKDSNYLQRVSATSLISQEYQGQKMDITMEITGLTNFKVTNIKDSVYDMEISYKELGMKMDFFGNTIEFDSLKDDINDMTSTLLKNMTNKTFNIKMTKTGQVLEVTNIDVLTKNLFDGIENISEEDKEQAKTQMMDSFGEKAFKGNIEMGFAIYPGKDVKKDDKWNVISKVESGFAMNLNTDYVLKDITKTDYVISGLGNLTTGEAYNEINGLLVKYVLTGTMDSNVLIDKKTGWPKESKVIQKINGTTATKSGADGEEDLIVPITITSNVIMNDK